MSNSFANSFATWVRIGGISEPGSDRAGDSRLQFGSAQPGFGSGGGFALTVSVFITLDEAATLTDVANPLYISSASAQVSSGLM